MPTLRSCGNIDLGPFLTSPVGALLACHGHPRELWDGLSSAPPAAVLPPMAWPPIRQLVRFGSPRCRSSPSAIRSTPCSTRSSRPEAQRGRPVSQMSRISPLESAELGRWLALERFDYSRVGRQWAGLRLLAGLDRKSVV